MKRDIPTSIVYGALALVLVVVLVVGWLELGGGGPGGRVAEFLAVSHRLSLARGDVTKLSPADQEYIKNHPSGFRPRPGTGGSGGSGDGLPMGSSGSTSGNARPATGDNGL